jgi:phosphatidate cytidylyltransferase
MTAFISRLAVVLAGLPVVLAVAYVGGWALAILLVLATLVALHELYRIARPLRPLVLAGYGGGVGAILGAQLGGAGWLLGGFLAVFPLAFLFAAVAETRQSTTVAIGTTVLGAAWIGIGLGHLVLIRDIPIEGRQAIFTLLLTVFVTDTMAYVGGRLAGRHKMTPVMSPGKTWEGFVLGAIAGLVTAWISVYGEGWSSGWHAFALGGAIVGAATIGDLFESLLKRDLGAKDTGRLLLGHGGILDRVDSLLFAAPAAYYTILALGQA